MNPSAGAEGAREHVWLSPDSEVRCPSMQARWGHPGPMERAEQTHAGLEIAIPGDHACVEVGYHTSAGKSLRTRVAAHHVSIIPAGQPHAVSWMRSAALMVLFLDPDFLAGAFGERTPETPQQIVEQYAAFDPFIRHLGLCLWGDILSGGKPSPLFLGSAACVLAAHLLRNYGVTRLKASDTTGLPRHLLRRAIDYIESNIASDLGVEEIAKAVGISTFHFARLFKQSTGLGPHGYVVHSRLERAKALLRHSDASIVEVALATGFASQSHLTTTFRKYAGVTPKVFRDDGAR